MGKTQFSILYIILSLLAPSAACADEEFLRLTPGDPERKDMLNAARSQSARDLGINDPTSVIFTVSRTDEGSQFCRSGDWVLLNAKAGQIDDGAWTPIAHNCGDADLLSIFLLNKQNGTWQVLRGGSICSTDAFWIGWRFDEEIGGAIPTKLFDCFGTYE